MFITFLKFKAIPCRLITSDHMGAYLGKRATDNTTNESAHLVIPQCPTRGTKSFMHFYAIG